MTSNSRYLIGIDLGTSNSALSFIDRQDQSGTAKFLEIEQWSMGGTIKSKTLPSFLSFLTKGEIKRGDMSLSFHGESHAPYMLGVGAKERAQESPDTVIHSSKSWLSHRGVNRKEKILPWNSDKIVGSKRLSPLDVASQFLRHLKDCWDHSIGLQGPEHQFRKQKIAITVPASFDGIAQELTLEAASMASYPDDVCLLEEPVSAFYGWKQKGEATGDGLILVCDIGGGTSDFTLLESKQGHIKRIKVSPHILLGGDNIDLALASFLEKKLSPQQKLASYPWAQLIAECRHLKEALLSESSQDSFHLSIHTGGGDLFGSTLSCEASREELLNVVKAFFPQCEAGTQAKQASGSLSEWGLPYASDPAFTHHLSEFLEGLKIDSVLFAGGTMKPLMLQNFIIENIETWQDSKVNKLEQDDLDLSIALGASHFLLAQQQEKGLIEAHYPKYVFAKVNSKDGSKALCIVEKGQRRGESRELGLTQVRALVNERVSFQIFESTRDQECSLGDIIPLNSSMIPVSSMIANLESETEATLKEIPISLSSTISETGLLELRCFDNTSEKSWPLSFDLNASAMGTESGIEAEKADVAQDAEISQLVKSLYGKSKGKSQANIKPKQLSKSIEEVWKQAKKDWDLNHLRNLWLHLEPGLTRKGRSVEHEAAWLNLAGFSLRPGYGHGQDPLYIDRIWKLFQLGLNFPKDSSVNDQWWIFWRRVAGGLSRERQEQLFDKIAPSLKKDKAQSPQSYLLAGSLERVDTLKRIQLGNSLAQQIASGGKNNLDAKIWCLSRLASRIPLYTGPEAIIRPINVRNWAETIAPLSLKQSHYRKLSSFYSLGGRMIGDREFDIDNDTRQHFLGKLSHLGEDSKSFKQVAEQLDIGEEDRNELFGEALPNGFLMA